MMLTEKILQGLIFVICFLSWDLYLQDAFYSWIVPEGEKVGLAEVAMGYGLIFIIAYGLSMLVAHRLSGGEESSASEY